jgi:hypothetical protein
MWIMITEMLKQIKFIIYLFKYVIDDSTKKFHQSTTETHRKTIGSR